MPVVVNNVIKAVEDIGLRTTKAVVILEEEEISDVSGKKLVVSSKRYEVRSTRYDLVPIF